MQLEWTAQDVLRAVNGQSLHAQDWCANGVSIDSRSTQKGDIFIAIQGPTLDGHAYVRAALDNGAVAAIVSRPPPHVPPDAPLIQVEDTFTALHALGKAGRARSQAKIIAVTGSVGKTSTKEQLRLMLGAVNDTYATQGSFNNHWGVPLSLARMPLVTKYGVFELGMNHAGELGPLAKEVRPSLALITNVEATHLEYFASVEAIAHAKAEIFEGLDPNGTAILNRDNAYYDLLAAAAKERGIKNILSFGHKGKCDAQILAFDPDSKGSNVEARIMGKNISYRVGAPGAHLAINALSGLLTCAALGVDIKPCAEALASFRAAKRRGTQEIITSYDGGALTLIDESYNASPVSMCAAFEVLGLIALGPAGRRIAVLGDMLELGSESSDLHAGLCDSLIEHKIDLVHCCGPLMRHLYDTLPATIKGDYAPDSTALATNLTDGLRDGDVVMVKGSKGSRMDLIVDAIRTLSDKQCKAVS